MRFRTDGFVFVLGIASALSPLVSAQNDSAQATPPAVTDQYPATQVGVLIYGAEWTEMLSAAPAKLRTKHGLAPMLTYGVAPAAMVAEYEGAHAPVRIEPGRPVICICHVLSIPGAPALVRLHINKKNVRELDAGKLHIGPKAAQAESADLIPVTVSQPENHVWLIQANQALPAGEYALMLGVQNMSIFPFTVAEKH